MGFQGLPHYRFPNGLVAVPRRIMCGITNHRQAPWPYILLNLMYVFR